MSPLIKKIAPDEWEKFKEIRLDALRIDQSSFGRALKDEESCTEEYWRERLGDPTRAFYAVEIENKFVSLAGIKKTNEGEYMIISVFTYPEHRGRGLADDLLKYVIVQAVELGIKKLILLVNTQKEPALNLYKKNGFAIKETRENELMGDGSVCDEYFMELDLNDTLR